MDHQGCYHTAGVLELRCYAMHPGQRDLFADIFDREFVESQEALGIGIVGQFRDCDDANAYIWMRQFADMEARRIALTRFYEGEVWETHRDAANATMIAWDDVLLLKPAQPSSGFFLDPASRPAAGSRPRPGVLTATIVDLPSERLDSLTAGFDVELAMLLRRAGHAVVAQYRTETSTNTYPRLPIREHASAFVWFSQFPSLDAEHAGAARLAGSAHWLAALRDVCGGDADVTVLRLAPTARSLLPGLGRPNG